MKTKPAPPPTQPITVPKGRTKDGFVVYGSPAKPKHRTVEQIEQAVRKVVARRNQGL